MYMVYVTLISRTAVTGYTIDNVTANLKAQVLFTLKQLGLDGYGRPLPEEE